MLFDVWNMLLLWLQCWHSCQYRCYIPGCVCQQFYPMKLIFGLESESVLFLRDTSPGAYSGKVSKVAMCTHVLYSWNYNFLVSSLAADLSIVLFSHVIESWKSTNAHNLCTVVLYIQKVTIHLPTYQHTQPPTTMFIEDIEEHAGCKPSTFSCTFNIRVTVSMWFNNFLLQKQLVCTKLMR